MALENRVQTERNYTLSCFVFHHLLLLHSQVSLLREVRLLLSNEICSGKLVLPDLATAPNSRVTISCSYHVWRDAVFIGEPIAIEVIVD